MSITEIAKEIPVIRAEGTNYDIGLAHGTQAKERIAIMIENLKRSTQKSVGLDWEACIKIASAFHPAVRNKCPEYLDEIRGIADGSGFSFDDIFTLNCRTELGGQFAYQYGKNMEEAMRLSGGCSVIGINGERTASGSTMYGQNWDAPPEQFPGLAFFIVRQENRPDIAWVGEAGLLCRMAGMNSAGIGMGGNSLFTDAPIDFNGLPLQFAYRLIMDQSSLHEAVEAAGKANIASNINLMLCSSEGEMVNMEFEYGGFGMTYMHDGVISHANSYSHPALPHAPYREKASPRSQLRHFRLSYLTENLRGNQLTAQDIMDILSEHTVNYPSSICQHGDDFATLFSTVCNLDKREMYISIGNPCGGYTSVRPFDE